MRVSACYSALQLVANFVTGDRGVLRIPALRVPSTVGNNLMRLKTRSAGDLGAQTAQR